MIKKPKVVVSGASSGIGAATAVRFAREGYDVLLTALDEAGLEATRERLPPGDHLLVSGDWLDPATHEHLANAAAQRWGKVNALISCAGAFSSCAPETDSFGDWDRAFRLVFEGALRLTQAVLPLLEMGGRIVHVSSIHAERAEAKASAYAAGKAAMNQLCRSLAVELAPRGILVNAIAPGFVRTPMSIRDGVDELESPEFQQNYVLGHHLPLRRPGTAEEIAGTAWFLAGPDSSYITGQVLTVDGGLTITF